MSIKDSIIKDATNYYTKKLNRFGPTFQGVDWNSKESQELRFDQLLKVIDKPDDNLSIIDYGCGYGALYLFMKNKLLLLIYNKASPPCSKKKMSS